MSLAGNTLNSYKSSVGEANFFVNILSWVESELAEICTMAPDCPWFYLSPSMSLPPKKETSKHLHGACTVNPFWDLYHKTYYGHNLQISVIS